MLGQQYACTVSSSFRTRRGSYSLGQRICEDSLGQHIREEMASITCLCHSREEEQALDLHLVTVNAWGPSVPHSSFKDASLQFLFSSFSRQGLIYIAQDDLEFTVWPQLASSS